MIFGLGALNSRGINKRKLGIHLADLDVSRVDDKFYYSPSTMASFSRVIPSRNYMILLPGSSLGIQYHYWISMALIRPPSSLTMLALPCLILVHRTNVALVIQQVEVRITWPSWILKPTVFLY